MVEREGFEPSTTRLLVTVAKGSAKAASLLRSPDGTSTGEAAAFLMESVPPNLAADRPRWRCGFLDTYA